MDTGNLIELTVYLVGADEEEARKVWPFDSWESARDFARDVGRDQKVYAASAWYDPFDLEEV